MAKPKTARSILRLRRLLLLALIVLVVVLGGLYWFGRVERRALVRTGSQDSGEIEAGEGVMTLGEGFEYTRYEGDRPAFSIRASRTVEDRQEQVFLEEVGIVVTEEDGRRWELTADRATYHRALQESLLEGNVRLEGGEGFALEAEGLDLSNQGRLLSSQGAVQFRYQDEYRGRGDRLRIHFPQELYLLSGDVLIESTPEAPRPLRLTAERAFLERSRQLLRADGGVRIEHGNDFLDAEEIHLFLADDLSRLRFFRARNDVRGRQVRAPEPGEEGPGRPTAVEAEGRGLVVVVQDDGRSLRDLQLEGSPAQPALLTQRSPEGGVRRLEAGYMTSKVEDDGSQSFRIFGGAELTERPSAEGHVVRRLAGDRGWADMDPDGVLQKARFVGGVEYRDESIEATGERVIWDAVSGTGEFFATSEGQPAASSDARVVVDSDRGRLRAPVVRYERKSTVVEAEGGVDTLLEESSPLKGTPLGSGEGPVRVESREAFFRDEPRGFLFRGDVRAWQGEALILTDWLRGDEDGRVLTAGGGVRTVWSAPAAERQDPEVPQEPLEVVSREMTYVEPDRLLVYEGQVRSEQQRRTLSCDRLEVELAPNGGADLLTCVGDVHLVDRGAGNDVRAHRVLYDPDEGHMEFFGAPDAPVVVKDRDGTGLQAQRIDYDLEDGRVHARRTEAATEEGPAEPPEDSTGEGEQES